MVGSSHMRLLTMDSAMPCVISCIIRDAARHVDPDSLPNTPLICPTQLSASRKVVDRHGSAMLCVLKCFLHFSDCPLALPPSILASARAVG